MTDPRRYDFERLVPPALMISAFGPLLIPSIGIRFDQVLAYGLLPIAIGMLCIGRKSIISQAPALSLLFIFGFIMLWTLVVTLGGVPEQAVSTDRTRFNEISGFENYFHIVAIIIILGIFIRGYDLSNTKLLLNKSCKLLIVLMSVNAIISLTSLFVDITNFTNYFVKIGVGGELTSYELSTSIGRAPGIFDYPSTAGTSYSLSLLGWTYLARNKKRISLIYYLYWALIIIGGAVTISKTFIFGGLPLFIIYWILPGRVSPRITIKLLFIMSAMTGVVIVYVDSWVGLDTITDLFTGSSKYAYDRKLLQYILMRYGVNSEYEIVGNIPYLWNVAPVHGLGFSYSRVLDSAYLQYFVEGGLVSLLLYCSFIALIIFVGAMEWFRGGESGRFLVFLGLFVLVAGIGSPVVMATRSNVIFWVIMMLLLAVIAARRAMKIRHTREEINIEEEYVVMKLNK